MSVDIKVVVEKSGELNMEVRGVKGGQCIHLTEFLERELGEVMERQKTCSYYSKAINVLRNLHHNIDL
ncbi:MAG: DUF2997 domain-containing protein [Deltaproteobacteria bacterium]|nr:DUF2997 domain-containing protein [Deltaproteobacteria bacterium]